MRLNHYLNLLLLTTMSPALSQTINTDQLSVSLQGSHFTLRTQLQDHPPTVSGQFPHPVRSVQHRQTTDPIWGTNEQLQLVHDNGWISTLTVVPGSPFLQIATEVRNTSNSPWATNGLPFLSLQYTTPTHLDDLRILGTGGLRTPGEAEGSYTFTAVANPRTRRGLVAGWLTHERGVGVFFPKTNTVTHNSVELDAHIEFGHFLIEPDQGRPTETLLVGCFDDARLGLEAYADAIAHHYRITLPPKPGVYCTWYHAGASDEVAIAANTDFAAATLRPFGLGVMQIDDKWQSKVPKGSDGDPSFKTTGPVKLFVDSREDNYPGGMAATARKIQSKGMVPGIWFMPFAGNYENPYFEHALFAQNPDGTPFHDSRWSGTCLDLTRPTTQAFVADRTRRIYDWGYRYFKIDGMHTGLASYNIYVHTAHRPQALDQAERHNPHLTHIEAYRRGLEILRETAPDTFILGCNVSQNMLSMGPAFGLIDAMRIGPDNGGAARGRWDQVTVGAWHGANLYFLNNRVWHNDPDPVYVRPSNPLSKARWMCSWLAISGAMHSSSEQYADLPPDRLDLLKRCLPNHSLPARPVDLFDSNQPRIWSVNNSRIHVVGLFNWNEAEQESITCPLERIPLDPSQRYVGYDYWANAFLAPFTVALEEKLEPGSCRVLALRPVTDHPQLLSTSRHITQGLVDVIEEKWDADTDILTGVSLVVADDPYELRIALPPDGQWTVSEATAGKQTLAVEDATDTGLRLRFTPTATGSVTWRVRFNPQKPGLSE